MEEMSCIWASFVPYTLARACADFFLAHPWCSNNTIDHDSVSVLRLIICGALRGAATLDAASVRSATACACVLGGITSPWISEQVLWLDISTLTKRVETEALRPYLAVICMQLLRSTGVTDGVAVANTLALLTPEDFLPTLWKLTERHGVEVCGATMMCYMQCWALNARDFAVFVHGELTKCRASQDELLVHANELYLMNAEAVDHNDKFLLWPAELYSLLILSWYSLGNIFEAWKLYQRSAERGIILSPLATLAVLRLRSHLVPPEAFIPDVQYVPMLVRHVHLALTQWDPDLLNAVLEAMRCHVSAVEASMPSVLFDIVGWLQRWKTSHDLPESTEAFRPLVRNILGLVSKREDITARAVAVLLSTHLPSVDADIAAGMLSVLLGAGWLHQAASVVNYVPNQHRSAVYYLLSLADLEALQQCLVVLGRADLASQGLTNALRKKVAEGRKGLPWSSPGKELGLGDAEGAILSVSYDEPYTTWRVTTGA